MSWQSPSDEGTVVFGKVHKEWQSEAEGRLLKQIIGPRLLLLCRSVLSDYHWEYTTGCLTQLIVIIPFKVVPVSGKFTLI